MPTKEEFDGQDEAPIFAEVALSTVSIVSIVAGAVCMNAGLIVSSRFAFLAGASLYALMVWLGRHRPFLVTNQEPEEFADEGMLTPAAEAAGSETGI